MKKSILYLMAGLLTLAVSCEKNPDPETYDDGLYDLSQVSVVNSGSIPLEEFYGKLLQDGVAHNADFDQSLYDYYSGLLAQAKQGGETKADDSGSSVAMAYAWTTLRYKTISATGEQIECSELLVWPYIPFTKQRPGNVVIGCHLTITSDEERPSNFSNLGFSNDVNLLGCFANPLSQKALVIIPDYEGYGATKNRNHPYLNREVTARQVVDGAKAGIAWYEKEKMKLADGWKSVAVGYSQGGAVAASVYRYCHENKENGLRLAGAVCGDGPYDPVYTMDQYIQSGKLFMPVSVALLLKGAIDTDPHLTSLRCTYDDFCAPEFVKTGVFDWLGNKSMNTKDIHNRFLEISKSSNDGLKMYCWSETRNEFLPYNATNAANPNLNLDLSSGNGMNYVPIEMCIKPSLVEYFRNGVMPSDISPDKLSALLQCLEENGLCAGGWLPPQSGGITFFHSKTDEVVPCQNLMAVHEYWDGVSKNFSSYILDKSTPSYHKSCGVSFLIAYSGTYTEEILSGKWTAIHKILN